MTDPCRRRRRSARLGSAGPRPTTASAPTWAAAEALTPPTTRRDDVVDVLHGVEVEDPYRWLEDGASPEVASWVEAQNLVARAVVDGPDRRALARPPDAAAAAARGAWACRSAAIGSSPSSGRPGPSSSGSPGAPPPMPTVAPTTLLDPATGADDAAVAIDWFEASDDGSLVAVGTSEGGTEESVLRVLDAATGADLGESIPDTRACSVAWDPDGRGFTYTRYPAGDQYHRTVHHHTLGDGLARRPGRVGRTPRSAGVARRRALAGRSVVARPRARRLGPLRRPPARPPVRCVVDGHRRRRGHVGVPLRRRRRLAGRCHDARRSARTGGQGAPSAHRTRRAGRRSSRKVRPCSDSSPSRVTRCGSWRRSGRSIASSGSRPTARHSGRSRASASWSPWPAWPPIEQRAGGSPSSTRSARRRPSGTSRAARRSGGSRPSRPTPTSSRR